MNIGDALGAIMSGGLTGILGSIVTAYSDLKKQKLINEHEREMKKLSIEAMKIEAEANLKIVEVETAGAMEVADAGALTESYKADRATYSLGIEKGKVSGFLLTMIDVLRGSVRPIITYYFTILISVMFYKFYAIYFNTMDMTAEILDKIVLVILYIGTTTILWWFGTRNKAIK